MTYNVITAKLIARTAAHIGSGEGNELTDALLRRDSFGKPTIPGTAIAGALRALLTRLAPRFGSPLCAALTGSDHSCGCSVCHLFGDINPSDEEESRSAASRLLVFNACPSARIPNSLIRDSVGIDRATGASANVGAVKYDQEVLPAGATFELRMELRKTTSDDEALLALGLAEWQVGRLWLGGNVARGLGAFTLTNLEYKTLEMETANQVLAFLREDRPWQQAVAQSNWLELKLHALNPKPWNDVNVARCWVTLTGVLQAEGPLLTNDTLTADASGFDHAPLLSICDDWKYPVLSGAGLRGVLRSHAERLARTLVTLQYRKKDDFLLHCPACDPNVRDEKRDEDRSLPLESCDSLLKKASAERDNIELCPSCQLFGSTQRGSRLIVEDAPYRPTSSQYDPVLKILDFLAIDRFTGGGKDGAKFDVLALWKPSFALHLHLDNPRPWELGWLMLMLRDLEAGWITVGLGGSKGFGRVTLKDWKATFGYLTPDDVPDVAQFDLSNQKRSGVYTTVSIASATDSWALVAKKWVKAFHDTMTVFKRPHSIRLTEDSYFGQVDELYPLLNGGAQ